MLHPRRAATKRVRLLIGVATTLIFASFIARVVAMPAFLRLPEPTGPFKVGTVMLDAESAAGAWPANGCRLSAQLWYPAMSGSGGEQARYSAPSSRWLSMRRWVRTNATLNAQVAPTLARYPVVLHVPGWTGERQEYTVQAQDVASRGFVVVAIGYDSPGRGQDELPPGGSMDFSSPAGFARTVQIANRKISLVASSATRIIDILTELDRHDPEGRFTGRLDLARIGALGNSLGGAIAMQIAWLDPRVKAVINVDGWVFDAAPGGWISQPFLLVSDDGPPPTPVDLVAVDPQQRYPAILEKATEERMLAAFKRQGGMVASVVGATHSDFSDAPFLARTVLLAGRLPADSAARVVADYAEAFFGRAFTGKESPLLTVSSPQVRLQVWEPPPVSAALPHTA